MSRYDPVTCPVHYSGNGEIECKDAIASMLSQYRFVPIATIYWAGCTLKYLWRWPMKGGKQDVLKAIECLENIVRLLDENTEEDDE